MTASNSEPAEEEVLVCGDCGRVNLIPHGLTRLTAVRCSACGVLLRGERQRKVSVECPGCRTRLEIDTGWLGESITCGNCQLAFTAERPQDRSLPGTNAPVEESAAPDPRQRVGMAEVPDEVEENPGRRLKVRRSRKKKRIREKSWKEILRASLAILATFGLVIGVIFEVGRRSEWWMVPPRHEEIVEKSGPEKPRPAELTSEENAKMNEVLTRFFSAPTPEEALAVCRFQGEVGERMRAHVEQFGHRPAMPVGLVVTGRHEAGTRLFLRFTGKGPDGVPVSVVVERPAPGVFLVDWDSHVRFASQSWDAFVAKRVAEPGRFQFRVKRVFAGNLAYPIEEFTSFFVFRDQETDGVNLFVRTDSPECAAMLAATEPDFKPPAVEELNGEGGIFPMTLEVFFPPEHNREGMPPALELKKFYHEGWVSLREG